MMPSPASNGLPPPSPAVPHICVCICTYRRLAMLERLLDRLARQKVNGALTYSVVVADNDLDGSARSVVSAFSSRSTLAVKYCHEPTKNIALVRNQALAHARGDYIAFIDDDEFPVDEWLETMLATCRRHAAAGVLGPVRPHFDTPPPQWLIKGGFCDRPEHPTGTVMDGGKCRTGNVLFQRSIIDGVPGPFKEEFGTGGEDVDFFRRMNDRGCVFIWCNEGVAYESVPPSRWTRSYLLKRALLRGRNNLRMGGQRGRLILTSLIAVPAYAVIAPLSALFGQHVLMKYLIRFCDHSGRLLTLIGLNPVSERPQP
jgi:succinoglycan biosynthesis protein ExoM